MKFKDLYAPEGPYLLTLPMLQRVATAAIRHVSEVPPHVVPVTMLSRRAVRRASDSLAAVVHRQTSRQFGQPGIL